MKHIRVSYGLEANNKGGGFPPYKRAITDELLGVVALDDGVSPYVDLCVEGVDMPFETINVWCHGENQRENDSMVLDLILDRFRTNREEHEEE